MPYTYFHIFAPIGWGSGVECDDGLCAEPFVNSKKSSEASYLTWVPEGLCDVLDMAALTRYELVHQSFFLKT
jgi:hypothetical protein